MNNYYETEPVPSCGIGKHPGTHMNGKCTKCDAYPRKEAEAAAKILFSDETTRLAYSRAQPMVLESEFKSLERQLDAANDERALLRVELAEVRRKTLLEAADDLRKSAGPVWGGDAMWMTTGTKVADVAAEWLEGRAEDG